MSKLLRHRRGHGCRDARARHRTFFLISSTKGVGKGTGLGLSMVHGLMAQLGGAMTIRSVVGEGTTIELWLPVSQQTVQLKQDVVERPSPPPEGNGIVLLVDDDPIVRMTTSDMLGDLGYGVIEAGSAEEALELIRKGVEPDVLVTDHLMPGMSGTQLARNLGALRPDLRVLIISGYAEEEGVDANIQRLIKPFRSIDLEKNLSALAGPV